MDSANLELLKDIIQKTKDLLEKLKDIAKSKNEGDIERLYKGLLMTKRMIENGNEAAEFLKKKTKWHPFSNERKILNEFEKLQGFVLRSVSRIQKENPSLFFKKAENYTKQFEKYETPELQGLAQSAFQIFQTSGPLCDSEGFYQHVGECWSDAIQQVMLFSDGFKEYTQKYFISYTLPHAVEQIGYLPDTIFVPYGTRDVEGYIKINRTQIDEQKKWVPLYLLEVQKRFLRHYITESRRRTAIAEETCSLNGKEPGEIALEKLQGIATTPGARKQGAEGKETAIFGKLGDFQYGPRPLKGIAPSLLSYNTGSGKQNSADYSGAGIIHQLKLINLFKYLILPALEVKTLFDKSILTALMESESSELVRKSSAVLFAARRGMMGHEVAMYTCGGKHFYYEDNLGIVPMNWKALLNQVSSLGKSNPEIQLVCYPLKTVHLETKETMRSYFYPMVKYKVGNSRVALRFFVGDTPIMAFADSSQKNGMNPVLAQTVKEPYVLTIENREWILDECTFLSNPIISPANKGYQYAKGARLSGAFEKGNETTVKKSIRELLERENTAFDLYIKKPDFFKYFRTENDPRSNLSIVIQEGFHESLIQLLLSDGESATALDASGKAPIHYFGMTSRSSRKALEYLLEAGADINAKSEPEGNTALHFAIQEDKFMAQLLLCKKGADKTIRNAEGKLPEDLTQDDLILDELKKCGGTVEKQTGGRLGLHRKTRRQAVGRKHRMTRGRRLR